MESGDEKEQPSQVLGFRTAAGNAILISEEALRKAKEMLEEIEGENRGGVKRKSEEESDPVLKTKEEKSSVDQAAIQESILALLANVEMEENKDDDWTGM